MKHLDSEQVMHVVGTGLRDGGALVAGTVATTSWLGWLDHHSSGLIAVSALAGALCSVTGFGITHWRGRVVHKIRVKKLQEMNAVELDRRRAPRVDDEDDL